jgi:hypothetical protein
MGSYVHGAAQERVKIAYSSADARERFRCGGKGTD